MGAALFQTTLHGRPEGWWMVDRPPPEPVPLIQSQKHPRAVYLQHHQSELSTPQTELMAVILEPTHPNPLLICCLSGYWLLVLSPIYSPVGLTDACILLVSQLPVKGTGVASLTSSHVFYFQYKIPQSACEDPTQVSHWGLDGLGTGIHKGQAFLSSVNGPYQGLKNDCWMTEWCIQTLTS